MLNVSIEIEGKQIHVGTITGAGAAGVFCYDEKYLQEVALPISISLPLQPDPFSAARTMNYFDGLLPEGFTRHTVAEWLHADEGDYLEILRGLGSECLGAVRVTSEYETIREPHYEPVSDEQVRALAREGQRESADMVTKAHLSLTGASGKVGLYYDEKSSTWFLPLGMAPSTHIVKQSHIRFSGLVTNEQLCLTAASNIGLDVPESFIIDTGGNTDGEVLFATRRYDRIFSDESRSLDGLIIPARLHQEDMAQAMGIPALRKYERRGENYFEKMFRVIRDKSADPIEDSLKLWDRYVFNYLVGNTDCHIKNVSLLYDSTLRRVRLAPGYDIVSTAVYDNSSRDMALSFGGKYSIEDITRDSFAQAAAEAGLGMKMAMRRFDDIADRFEKALRDAADELKEKGFPDAGRIAEKIIAGGGIAGLL